MVINDTQQIPAVTKVGPPLHVATNPIQVTLDPEVVVVQLPPHLAAVALSDCANVGS